jgi:CheY-like chemotaxis protein
VLPDLTGVNVLVVEDDPVSRRVYQMWLDEMGATVRCAEEGFSALEFIWEARADIVLCDLRMPNINGYAFIQAMRNDLKVQTPVIAITGAPEHRAQSLDAGFAACMTKPITLEQLGAQIAGVLRLKVPGRE